MKKPTAQPMNARLEWRGRKLMCNGVCVAFVYKHAFSEGWHGTGGAFTTRDEFDLEESTLEKARRSVNKRFGLKDSTHG